MDASTRVFVKEGEYWTIAYGGTSFRVKDAKGLRYIACLLKNPGREMHVLDLVASASGAERTDQKSGRAERGESDQHGLAREGDAGEILDARARAEYLRRITELESEIDEATAFNDTGRHARAEDEIAALRQQLSAAFGLGGRARRAGSSAERARVNVRNSIASSLKVIGQHSTRLSQHLSKSIRTGSYCMYVSDAEPWMMQQRGSSMPESVSRDRDASNEAPDEAGSSRMLATLLFTDIVASTKQAAELGDKKWRRLLDRHDAVLKAEIERSGGRAVKSFGDSFFATFDVPAKAIRCAVRIHEAVAPLGIKVRASVHTGECERRGDDLGGIGVHIGARILSAASAGEILVSSTVRELVAGSGTTFDDRGFHTLRGVPGTWRLFSVASAKGASKNGAATGKKTQALSLMLVDDHPMWRQTLRTVLEASGAGTVVAEASDGGEAVEMAVSARPDVIVMDMNLPTMNGVEATRRIMELMPDVKVLMLSSSDEKQDVISAVQAGAAGYLLKTSEPGDVAEAVRRVKDGEVVFPPSLARHVLEEFRKIGGKPKGRTAAPRR
ncbi:MAG: hypothetical protein NVSMB57_01370 [Actinomycetota bacterium]